jgi:hypothetical protein
LDESNKEIMEIQEMIEQLKVKNGELRKIEIDGNKKVHNLTTEVNQLGEFKHKLEKENQIVKESAIIKEREIR